MLEGPEDDTPSGLKTGLFRRARSGLEFGESRVWRFPSADHGKPGRTRYQAVPAVPQVGQMARGFGARAPASVKSSLAQGLRHGRDRLNIDPGELSEETEEGGPILFDLRRFVGGERRAQREPDDKGRKQESEGSSHERISLTVWKLGWTGRTA